VAEPPDAIDLGLLAAAVRSDSAGPGDAAAAIASLDEVQRFMLETSGAISFIKKPS
jgi:hypothetical protein